MSEDRFQREDPLRTDPIRNFSTTLRSDGWSGATGPTDPPGWMGSEGPAAAGRSTAWAYGGSTTVPSGSDFVLHGIRLGNAVIRDQMQRGQEFAEQLAAGLGAPAADLRQVLERMLRSYSGMYIDTTLLWMDLLFQVRIPTATSADAAPGIEPIPFPMLPGGDLRKVVERMLQAYSGMYIDSMLLWMDLLFPKKQPDNSSLKNKGTASVAVFSSRPTLCTLSLKPGAENQPLEACQLWSRDTTKPPLMDVSFQTGSDGKTFLLVRVPDNQPADLYLGVVCNRKTGEPLGDLAIEIRQP
ncbi:MAG TPA: hypothetical protein VKM72_17375 [Thermoanaerobaculia bacterium]|nr:hypothetical protein [Thermoanaerobaculia bacterium]